MKTYNEIYPAEGWADKISKYLRKVAEEKPNMYAKTKKRYENLAYSLLDSAALIASILEEDSLVPKSDDEFDELSVNENTDFHQKLEELNHRFKMTDEFSSPSVNSPPSVHSLAPQQQNTYEVKYHDICRYYDDILREANSFNFGYSEVNDCAKMLYFWFHTRFMPEIQDPDFTCQIRYLPTWIMSFIIVYGKYFQLKKVDQFHKMLDKWCDKVKAGGGGIYAIPYEIYKVEKEYRDGICSPADYTIDAVVINDILVSGCLYKLGDDEYLGAVRYNPGDLAAVVRDRNPFLDNKVRTRIANRKKLVREIGLTPVGGIDIDE